MVHIDQGDLDKTWEGIVTLHESIFSALLKENELDDLRKLLQYIYSRSEMEPEETGKPLVKISASLEEVVMTTAQKLLEKGKQEGIEQGTTKGKLERSLETARTMLEDGLPLAKVIMYSGLSERELREHKLIQ